VVSPASPATPAAETGDAVAPALGQPASTAEQIENPTADDGADIDAWIRSRAFGPRAYPTLTPDGVVPTAELESAASGEPAPASGDVSPDAPRPGPDGEAGTPPPGRRAGKAAEAQATIESLKAEVESLRSTIPEQVAEAQRRADEARAEAERLRSEHASADRLADETIGTPEEYARLLETPDDDLSNDDLQKREAWKANRRVFGPVRQRLIAEEASRAHAWVTQTTQGWAEQALAVADELGVDRADLAKPENRDVGRLMRLAASVTEARIRAEYAERLSQAERDRDTARGEALGGRRSPITNGAASGGAGTNDDINAWIRQRAGFA
jgi:FtsZ-binding cell division protein ZapB